MTTHRRPSIQDLKSALGTGLGPPLVRPCALTAHPAACSQDSKSRCRVSHPQRGSRLLLSRTEAQVQHQLPVSLGSLKQAPSSFPPPGDGIPLAGSGGCSEELVQDTPAVGSQDRAFQPPNAMLGTGQALRYCPGFRLFKKPTCLTV